MNENFSEIIFKALNIIVSRVNLITPEGDPEPKVQLGNIAQYESESNDFNNGVVCSLVNIEEEATLRNGRFSTRSTSDDEKVFKHNPPEYFNLYILFSATHTEYTEALKDISRIASFFQQYLVLNQDNEVELNRLFDELAIERPEALRDAKISKLIFELFTLSVEQLNHLWGILGGKYFPSLLYKCRLVELLQIPDKQEDVIKSIERNEKSL